jgi:hypothetical protein
VKHEHEKHHQTPDQIEQQRAVVYSIRAQIKNYQRIVGEAENRLAFANSRLQQMERESAPSPSIDDRLELYANILNEPNVLSGIRSQGGLYARIGQIAQGLHEIVREMRKVAA